MQDIPRVILNRINELKSQKVHLRPFISSDKQKIEELDAAIKELEWAHRLVSQECAKQENSK